MIRRTWRLVWSLITLCVFAASTVLASASPCPPGPFSGQQVIATYAYDYAVNTSAMTMGGGLHSVGALAPVEMPAKFPTGELSVVRRGFVAADSGVDATTVVGRRGSPLKVARGTNEPAVIGGRSYGGQALDGMQSEGFTPTVVDDAITNGQAVGSSGRIGYHSPANNITVVTESDGKSGLPDAISS